MPTTCAFDPKVSEHGTHVSGIVAGAYGTVARPGLGLPVVRGLSGVAPGAWLGNYRGLARGDHESGAIGSTVELAAAVDTAVADGMDVLNLSLGGPQIDPTADALALALANAARAGDPVRRRGRQRLRLARLRLRLVAGHERDRHHRRGDLEHAGLRGQRPRERLRLPGARARSPRCRRSGRACRRRSAARRGSSLAPAYGLDRRGCREPSRRHALRAVVLLVRGGCSFGTKAINAHDAGAEAVIVGERSARAAVRRRGGGGAAAARGDRRRRQPAALLHRERRQRRAGALHARDRRAAHAGSRADRLLVGRADAVRSPAQAGRLGPGRGDPVVDPARLDRLPRRVRVVGGHVDGRARRSRAWSR